VVVGIVAGEASADGTPDPARGSTLYVKRFTKLDLSVLFAARRSRAQEVAI